MWWLTSAATSTEGRFQALVTLIGGVLAILVVIGGLIWRGMRYLQAQEDATRANTRALVGTDEQPGLIDTVAKMQASLDQLSREVAETRRTRRRWF